MNRPIITLSLGGGVQSSCVIMLSQFGELPALDFAVFADTQHEPRHTKVWNPHTQTYIKGGIYGWMDWLEKHVDFPVHTVTAGDMIEKATEVRMSAKSGNTYIKGLIPAFMKQAGGRVGLLGRKCTLTNAKDFAEYNYGPH